MYMGLQIGRGLAAVLVVLHHISLGAESFYGGKFLNDFFKFGSIGVDFFFVLSGFIIYYVHSRDEQNKKNSLLYIKKRIIRIYPPFILISIILLIAYSYLPTLSASQREIGLITSILLIPTPPLEPALSVSWTLMHEMLFYTIFTTFYFSKNILFLLLFTWAIAIIIAPLTSVSGLTITFFLNPHNLQFIFGIIAAIIIHKEKGKFIQLIIGILLFFLYIYFNQYDYLLNVENLFIKIYLGISFMLIVTGLCKVDHKIKYPTFLLLIGSASYSLYLIHNPLISILNRVSQRLALHLTITPNTISFIIFVLCILFGIIYYRVWEKPMLHFLRKYFITKNLT